MLATFLKQSVRPRIPTLEAMDVRRRLYAVTRKVAVDFAVRDYHVKTVETPEEFKQVLALRREVFHYEFAKKWISLKSDKDVFDAGADHLAIFDRKAGCIAGVYRLIPSMSYEAGRPYYAATEFDVSGFLRTPGQKVELSRACIAREYRNGIVIALLWKGLAEYAKAAGADYLFGLSSINTMDLDKIAKVHHHFASQGILDRSYGIEPTAAFKIDGLHAALARQGEGAAAAGQELVPPLLKTYIKAGARVCSQPVIDRDFNCADWLTVLDLRQLTGAYDRKFMRS